LFSGARHLEDFWFCTTPLAATVHLCEVEVVEHTTRTTLVPLPVPPFRVSMQRPCTRIVPSEYRDHCWPRPVPQ
jgi:hypothetical protein